jgi:hypothetical protein
MTPAATAAATTAVAGTMTEPAPRRPRIRVPGPFAVIAGSLGVFFAILGLLAARERLAVVAEPVATAAPPPRRVIERRVVLTRIVVHRRPANAPGPAATASAPRSAPPAPAAPAPARAQAPAPAPAPAPSTPAPVTTRSS